MRLSPWLRDYLFQQRGSAKAADIIKAARADGIAEATLKRAQARWDHDHPAGLRAGLGVDERLATHWDHIQLIRVTPRELIRMS